MQTDIFHWLMSDDESVFIVVCIIFVTKIYCWSRNLNCGTIEYNCRENILNCWRNKESLLKKYK